MKKTFIKMQSLSRKAWLCGGLIAMAAAFVGCSSDAPDPGDNPDPAVAQTDGDPLTVISDQATLSGLVLNYENNNSSEAPKAFKLDAAPGYSDATTIDKAAGTDGKMYNDGKVKIPTEYKGDLDVNGKKIDIFIEGGFEGNIINTGDGGSVNVYILEKGMWRTGANSFGNSTLKIYDYSNGLTFQDNVTSVTMLCSYYGKEFNQSGKTFTLENDAADLFVEGEIKVGSLASNCKAQISAKCFTAEEKVDIIGSQCYIGSYMEVENLWLQNGGCIYLNKRAYVKVNKALDCFDALSGFYSPDEAVIYANEYYFGADKNNIPSIENVTGQFRGAIDVYAAKIYNGNSEVGSEKQYLVSELPVQGDNIHIYSAEDGAFNNFKEPMTGCPSGDNPVNPNQVPDKLTDMPVVIIHVTGTHTHSISATGIDVSGNKAYVSWHEQGGNIHGCIEAIEINGQNAGVTSWIETPRWEYASGKNGANASTAYDFNHIIYDDQTNSLLTVGENVIKGGFIGRIKLVDGKVSVLENRQLGVEKWSGNENQGLVAGGSGNCVVISPDRTKLLVASRGGYLAIPYDDPLGANDPFAKGENGKNIVTSKMIKSLVTAGSGKHLALFGNQLVSIEYTKPSPDKENWWEDRETALPAQISIWNREDFPEGEPTKSVEVEAFSPVFGKDVIAMDASGIYSCQGHRGVAKYDASLTEVKRFNVDRYIREHRDYFTTNQIIRMTGSAANGLAVDDKYLYIAYGGAGLWVLDKEKFEPVGFYVTAGTYPENESKKASANYVRVMADGKIFVAYGRDGVKVLEMESTRKARGVK